MTNGSRLARQLLQAAALALWAAGCGVASDPQVAQPTEPSGETAEVDAGSQPLSTASFAPDAGHVDAAAVTPDAATAVDPGPARCEATDPRSVGLSVFAEPDASEAPFVSVLSSATHDIRVMVYLMGYGGILDTLRQKAAAIPVRVILDQSQKSTNQKYFDQLTAAGAQVQWSDPQFTYMHAKTLIVDGQEAVISTGNYSLSEILKERNFVVQDEDPQDVATLVALFDADWVNTTPNLTCTRLLVSPVNSKPRLLALINAATKTLVIESMQFADTDVRSAVAARKAAGVDVRVLLADPTWITANTAGASFLTSNQIPVRWLASPVVHVKAMVADGTTAYAGSENLSWTSLTKNREVGVITSEAVPVKAIADTFEQDWAIATSF